MLQYCLNENLVLYKILKLFFPEEMFWHLNVAMEMHEVSLISFILVWSKAGGKYHFYTLINTKIKQHVSFAY